MHQLPPCSKSAWLKLQLWRAAATVPVLVALPVLTSRANKEARVAEIEHESLEWLGIAEPSQETPNAVELDTGIHHGSAMRDAGADGAARGATALHRAVSGPAIKRDVVPIRITAPGGEVTPRSAAAVPRPPPRAPSSFGTEQRRASEAAESQRAWVIAQEQRSHSPLVSGATTPTGGERERSPGWVAAAAAAAVVPRAESALAAAIAALWCRLALLFAVCTVVSAAFALAISAAS